MKPVLIKGIHHITALSRYAQRNIDFYTGILGLRLVKKTVNFDAPEVYHFYYGDETGTPGSIMTFFPYQNMRPGAHGTGQVATTGFSIPSSSIDYWIRRLDYLKIPHKAPQNRFDEVVIYFEDWDGLGLELIASDRDDRIPFSYGHIPLEHSIRGFYSAELWEYTYEKTESLLVNHLDFRFVRESGTRRRYSTDLPDKPGTYIDILWDAQKKQGAGGSGTVHHIAFETASDENQLTLRENLLSSGLRPTSVQDRQYFRSIYFREPGGVLFEVATSDPGFLLDESPEDLGAHLKLPPWAESRRKNIEDKLDTVKLNVNQYESPA